MEERIELKVNGDLYQVRVNPIKTLLSVLREDLELTGAKMSCGYGVCGSCTVLLDGKAVCSCLVLAFQAKGREIVTIEGLSNGDELHPLQESFINHGAIQCGYCTPGMILSAMALLAENPNPDEYEIRRAIAGNLCRCTGYVKIVEAIKAASEKMVR